MRLQGRGPLDKFLDRFADGWFISALIVGFCFALVAGGIAAWTREQPLRSVGRVMDNSRVVRVEFTTANEELTEQAREAARQAVPRVYRLLPGVLDALVADLNRVGQAAAQGEPFDSLAVAVIERFELSEKDYVLLRQRLELPAGEGAAGPDGAPENPALEAWQAAAMELGRVLERSPLLDRESRRRAVTEGRDLRLELIRGESAEFIPREQTINIDDGSALESRMARFVEITGFPQGVRGTVTTMLTAAAEPTFSADDPVNAERQARAAEAVQQRVDRRSIGQLIYSRGDVMTQSQYDLYATELRKFRDLASPMRLWGPRFATFLTILAVVGLTAGALTVPARGFFFKPANPVLACSVVLAAQIIAAVIGVLEQRFALIAALGVVLLVSAIFAIVHRRAFSLVLSAGCSTVVWITIDAPPGWLVVMLTGAWVLVGALGNITSRRAASLGVLASALACVLATPTAGLLGRPATAEALGQAVSDAALAGLTAIVTGSLAMFALPAIERLFGVVSGLKLIELRDPKQPLLKQMQRLAPGTYNHSLNVASIAETAADAVGADALLTYVGALYHDIGKINKPEYFVENQSAGINKHDALTPAMSLLIIVGHVKDGLEIAREYHLPEPLHHFIEGHHGTTLVEFFYRRALKLADQADQSGDGDDDDRPPLELDYRYPGPRPRTKECAVLMLADAVESATRALPEPTPSRIEALVRELAEKRLMDGQFDDCNLTFQELHIISETIARTVTSIYHGRVQYPGDEKHAKDPKPAAAGA